MRLRSRSKLSGASAGRSVWAWPVNQKDSDSLPEYDVLDPILAFFIEKDLSVAQIVERGFDKEVVVRVLEMVKRNEYKRRQAPPGIRISERAFGRDWRYPITSKYTFPE